MEYENKHGLKRTIRGAVRVAMAIAGGAFGEKYNQPKFIENSAQDSLYRKLTQMVDGGKFEKAENILWERAEKKDLLDLQLAAAVYSYMNEKEDTFIEQSDFSREEIEYGIRCVMNMYGFDAQLVESDKEKTNNVMGRFIKKMSVKEN